MSNRSFGIRRGNPVLVAFLFASLIGIYPSLGQDAVLRGTVIDDDLGRPLPGANVRASFPAIAGVATDLSGAFELQLPAGTYTLTVSFVGFESDVREITLGPGDQINLTIRLRQAAIQVNPITITASRRLEKLLDAPASITVLDARQLEAKTALTAASHLASVPAVDLMKTGLVSSRVVIRGFNDNLASSLLTLIDNRIARAPSVRLTALQLIPIVSGDIEQMEIVSGPASALYGPNAANGVVHIITRSPFESKGTRVSIAGGERDVLLGSIRHAGTYASKIGYKVSLQYYTGTDFEFFDPVELDARRQAIVSGARLDTLKIAQRDFDVRNLGLNGRVDFRIRPEMTLILNGGITLGDNIEVTPTGAAQVNNARIGYAQARFLYKNLFLQAYGNFLHSGDSFFLRTGQVFKDHSKMMVLQAQHHLDLSPRQRFTYGADAFFTVPEGEGTVTGQYEDRDQIWEVGAYLQSETNLSTRLSLIGAGRIDYHDRLGAWTVSPRVAIVFKPRPTHNFRATYNLAFKTPIANDLFSDVLGQVDLFQLGQMRSVLGFAPTTDLRVQGMFTGFHFDTSSSGRALFRSPFAPLAGLNSQDFIEVGDAGFTDVMWDVARFATVAGLADGLADTGTIDRGQVDAINAALDAVLPDAVEGVGNTLKILDLDTQDFVAVSGTKDFGVLKVTRTETLEIGYKGVVGSKLVLGVDAYRTNIKNFFGPFQVGTPNVFLDPSTLFAYLSKEVAAALDDPVFAQQREALLPLDQIPLLGNNDGSAAREIATLISTGIAGAIPFGTVSPNEAFDPTAIILMRRSFGDISVSGIDVSFNYSFSRHLKLGGMYSYVSDNYFENVDGVDDISLNAPRHKGGATFFYETTDRRFGLQLRARYVDGYRVKSDVYVGQVEGFGVFDAALDYSVPFSKDTRVNLTIQNLTNNKHREFVFVPEIGRLAMLRITHEF